MNRRLPFDSLSRYDPWRSKGGIGGTGIVAEFQEKYGPWALVTGASSGIGAAFARRLARRHLNVVLVARRADRLNALAEELQSKYSVQTRVVSADLSRDDFLPAIAQATEELEIHLLVNNAGAGMTGEFLSNDLDTEIRTLNLNCRAPLVLTHHFGRLMQRRGRGGVIFLASIVAFAGMPSWSNYAATKAQNLLFAEGLAVELRRYGVDVLALCPGFTRTELLALTGFGRLMSKRPDAVARVALRKIGLKRRVTIGLLNKAAVFSTRFQSRLMNTRIFGVVFRMFRDAKAVRAAPVVEMPVIEVPVPEEPVTASPVSESMMIDPLAPEPPDPLPERPVAPPIVASDAAGDRPRPVVEVQNAQDATPGESQKPRPAPIGVADDDDRFRLRPRRPRYTPPPKSTLRSKD